MRVLFNALTALKPKTGIGHYAAQLATELQGMLSPDEFAVWPPSGWARVAHRCFPKPGAGGGTASGWKTRLKSGLKTVGQSLLNLHFARHCRMYDAKIYHEPNYLPFAAGKPTVITVHDLSVIRHPEWHPARRVKEHSKKLERSIAKALHIITDTEQVKREIIADFGTGSAKITAIPLGVSEAYQPTPRGIWQERFELPGRYFLCVGTIEPRKNLLTAMRAFAAIPANIKRDCRLLLAGPWGWRAEAEHQFYERFGQVAGIRHLGYVPDEAMPALYSNAVATLYPSLYEGFGLPPLESVACGTPVIASRGTLAVHEVMGRAATYCEATDIDQWRDAIMESLDTRKTAIMPAGFTWRQTAMLTSALYDKLLNGAAGTVSLRQAA